jgi:hypothetical protein
MKSKMTANLTSDTAKEFVKAVGGSDVKQRGPFWPKEDSLHYDTPGCLFRKCLH